MELDKYLTQQFNWWSGVLQGLNKIAKKYKQALEFMITTQLHAICRPFYLATVAYIPLLIKPLESSHQYVRNSFINVMKKFVGINDQKMFGILFFSNQHLSNSKQKKLYKNSKYRFEIYEAIMFRLSSTLLEQVQHTKGELN